MLLVAVTGPVGSGKTTLLRALASWFLQQGRSIDGFAALAEERSDPTRGASRYDLLWLASDDRTPFAHRGLEDPAGSFAYTFDTATEARLDAWASGLAESPAADLIVLDEFGRLEAEGFGHARRWEEVVASGPSCVAIGIRNGARDDIERVLDRRIDIVVDARDPRAFEQLIDATAALDDWQRVGVYGAGSGGIEMSVGSALHGVKFPLTGLVMSTTQSVVLASAVGGLARRDRVVWVPFIAAGLKALSPAGSRLGPMVAISVQGILFSGVVRLLGVGRFALFCAGFLVGAWAGAQGVLIQYVVVGDNLFKAYAAITRWLAERWAVQLPSMVALVATLTVGFGLVAGTATAVFGAGRSRVARIRQALETRAGQVQLPEQATSRRTAWLLGAKDLLRPSFWIPVLLVVLVLKLAGSPGQELLWIAIRALAVAFVLFSLVRLVDPLGLTRWLRGKGHWGPALAFERALKRRR